MKKAALAIKDKAGNTTYVKLPSASSSDAEAQKAIALEVLKAAGKVDYTVDIVVSDVVRGG